MILAALIGDVILLPALLVGALGTILERSAARSVRRAEARVERRERRQESRVQPHARPTPTPHLAFRRTRSRAEVPVSVES